ncbi:RING finger [Fusarium acuminatum]|uniref:RING finger n=1 Tax=Fusarium acuminatum TaxID=5515 RepID=A0ABZ2X2R7_9HYPO
MSSPGERHGHLDATTGRDVVYCHACAGEWYRDENGLTCPECQGEITEIIDPENDPRDLAHHSSASTSPEPNHYDSDPEEADIDEHAQHGFVYRRSVRVGPEHHHHHDPAVAPIFERFFDMLNGFGPRSPGGNASFPPSPGEHTGEQNSGTQTYRTTFTPGPFGGGTTVTIIQRPIHATGGAPPGNLGPSAHAGSDPFQEYAQSLSHRPEGPGGLRVTTISMTIGANQQTRFLSNMLRDVGPPTGVNQGGEEGDGGPPAGFARSLHDILSLLSPANAMHGDAVNNGDSNQSQGPASGAGSNQPNPFGQRTSFMFNPGWESHEPASHTHSRPVRYSRPPSQSQSRLNEALRNISTQQQERERERDRDRGTTSGFSYDTSRLQRRSSHSPTSPRATAPSEHGARMRQRSPSQSSRRSTADSDQQRRPSGQGPISWLRDQFSRGPGNGSPRDGRRQ